MCTDKKKAVLGDFRAKKASYPSRTACLGFKNCFFVNYRLATARHGVRSAKLLNFLFTFKKSTYEEKKGYPTLRAVYIIIYSTLQENGLMSVGRRGS